MILLETFSPQESGINSTLAKIGSLPDLSNA